MLEGRNECEDLYARSSSGVAVGSQSIAMLPDAVHETGDPAEPEPVKQVSLCP